MTEKKDETKATIAAALLPVMQNFVHKYVGKVCDIKVVSALLSDLDPVSIAASNGLPSLVGMAVEQLPLEAFTGEVAADLIKDSAIEAARALSAKIQEKGGKTDLTPTEYEDALNKGAKIAAAKRFVIVDGLLHFDKCLNIQHHLRSARQGKDQPQQNGDVQDVTLGEAAEIPGLKVAPCCSSRVDSEMKKPAEAPKVATVAPPRSPMEVMMRGTEEQRKDFFDGYDALDPDMRQRVDGLLKHCDSQEEFAGLIYVITTHPQHADQLLALMENANGSHQTAQYLKLIGQAIARGSAKTLQMLTQMLSRTCEAYHEIDATLAPVVQRLEANAAAGDKRRPAIAALLEVAPQRPRKRGLRDFLKALTRVL